MPLKHLLVSLLFTASLLAGNTFLYPFVAYTSYSGSFKKSEAGFGLYANVVDGKHLFKLGAEYKDASYNDTRFDSFQSDLSVGYTLSAANHLSWDLAAHLTLSDLYQADATQVYLAGVSYVKKQRFSLGMHLYYSRYNDYSLADSVTQLSPYWGIWFGESASPAGRIFFKATYNYINPSGDNVALRKHYDNAELSVLHFKGNFTNTLAVSFGKSVNLVKDKAFTVYNYNEIHDRGLLLSSAYALSKRGKIKLTYIYEEFDEYDPLLGSSKQNASLDRFVLSASLRF